MFFLAVKYTRSTVAEKCNKYVDLQKSTYRFAKRNKDFQMR